jgi:dihydrofolate synthase/folylpolyglutamate synthase
LLVDGAHNPAAMTTMLSSVDELRAGRRIVAVFAAMRNKDIAAMATALERVTHEVIVTAPDVERAATAEALVAHFSAATVARDPRAALHLARRRAGRDGLVLICGSLYLAAEVLSESAA